MANQPKNYKKFVATAATATLVASAIVPVASAASFSDIEGNTHADAIKALSDAGIIKGYEDGTFKPNAEINRGQTVKLLGRWLETKGYKVPEDWNTKQRFNDLPVNAADQELVKYAALVKDAGVFNGSNGNLNYSQPMQRQQMAVVLVRAIKTIEGIDLIQDYKAAGFQSSIKDLDKAFSTENVEAITALEYAGITVVENFNPTSAITRGQFASFLNRTINYETPVAKVVSVSAINGAQLQVKFSKPVEKSSVIDSDDTLKAGVLTITKIDGTGSVTIDGNSLASLSDDKKTLTITVTAGALNSLRYVASVPENTIQTTEGKYIEKFTSEILSATDAAAPTITKIETINASKVRVHFSEPLASAGNWTFKLADNTTPTVTPDTTNINKGYVDLTIDAAVAAGKEITATIIGAADYANNLVNPNPATIKFVKGQLDGVKPTVSSITPLGLNKFEVKFSEEVQGFDGSDIKIDTTTLNDVSAGNPANLEAGEAKVTQDKDDKTKYTVELGTAVTAGIHTVTILANGVSDLSGETNDAYSKVVEFKADTTAPKLVSSEIKKENGVEYLYLTFDETVTVGTVNALSAKQLKDYVTTSGTIDLSGLTAVNNTDNKQYKVALNAVTFTPSGGAAAALSNGASYTVTLENIADTNSNSLAKTTITFTRGTDTDTNKPSIVTTFDAAETSPLVASNGVKVIDNDTIQVQFDRALDGASATNKNNYRVNGLAVESATLLPNNVVELKLAADTNALTGLRNVTISGVKSKDGVLMDTFTANEYLVENVKPYVVSAALVDTDKIKVTFSEAVTVSTVGAEDFEVLVGSTAETGFTVAQANTGTTDKEYIITLANALTPAEYAQAITLKVKEGATNIIVDANNNKVKTGEVSVSK